MSAKNAILHIKRTKIIAIIVLIILLLSLLIPEINIISYGSQYREQTDIEQIDEYKYPGYKELLRSLKAKYPNWTFTLLYTGLNWTDVLYNEKEVLGHSANLVQAKTGEWVCHDASCLNEDGTSKAWEGTNWYCASYKSVAYYMDTRNFLSADELFQFEQLSYSEGLYTLNGVEKILAGTFMANTSPSVYYGNANYSTKSFAQIMLDVGKAKNISPYHIASRIRQEVVLSGGAPSNSVTGTVSGYEGVFNFFNIGATTGSGAIQRGLKYAQNASWTSPEAAITGGAAYIAERYISIGQDTLYLQKFNVDSQDGRLYNHQYQANIQAPESESKKIYKTYSDLGLLNSNLNFIIPVFENMPKYLSPLPGTQTVNIVTENVIVNGTDVNIRENRTTNSTSLARVNTGDILLRIEKGTSAIDGYVWDKVVLSDGKIGYIAEDYVLKTEDVITCNTEAYTTTGTNLRNGPGTMETTIIDCIQMGEKITIIDSGRYYIDGYNWDRVKLANGTQGYIASEYLSTTYGSTEGDIVKVIANGSLQLRAEPGMNAQVLSQQVTGTLLIRLQANVSNADGLQWDKVKTMTGTIGYVASKYLELVAPKLSPNDAMIDLVIDDTNKMIKCEPNVKLSNILEKNENIIVKNKAGESVTDENALIGTGFTATINKVEYKIVKLGDTSGDGAVDPRDSLRVLRYSVETYELKDEFLSAGDINKDGIVDSRDSLRILRYAVNLYKIEL